MSEWQPIESAPHDEPVLVFVPEMNLRHDGLVLSAYLSIVFNRQWRCSSDGQPLLWSPTYWRSLPDPPKP
jgi:hypothetical protein